MTKTLKVLIAIVGAAFLVVAALVFWQRDALAILSTSKELEGPTSAIPESASVAPAIATSAADWVCWRGAEGNGRSRMTGIPTDWSAGLKKVWEVDFLCQGKASAVWSAPVIQGNRLVVCGRDETNDLVFCLSPADGRLLWKTSYSAKAGAGHGTGARATPWIDGDRVYTFGRSGDLVCWNLVDGSKRWHTNVADEGGKAPKWGHSSSPLVTDTLVVVSGGGAARTVAYDKMTGALKWKTGNGPAGYAGIAALSLGGEPALLAFHGKGLAALDPKDGRELWNAVWETAHNVNAATPVADGDRVFITSGYGTGGELLKVDRSGARVLWRNKAIASHHSDPFIIDGHIYGYSGQSTQNKGSFKCLELDTGAEMWATGKMGWGTCVYVDGYLLCCDIKGNLSLMKPDSEKFVKVAGMSKALGDIRGPVWTIPVLANGKLFLRFKQMLVCYEFTRARES